MKRPPLGQLSLHHHHQNIEFNWIKLACLCPVLSSALVGFKMKTAPTAKNTKCAQANHSQTRQVFHWFGLIKKIKSIKNLNKKQKRKTERIAKSVTAMCGTAEMEKMKGEERRLKARVKKIKRDWTCHCARLPWISVCTGRRWTRRATAGQEKKEFSFKRKQ